jgi:DNA-binding NtrC family response regulator
MARVLVIDDQPMVLKCVKSALSMDKHDVATVCAGDLALKLLGSMPFDIIITDFAMPRMDGLEFLKVAAERCPDVPVIMITGYGTPDTAMQAMSHGAFDYLPKPFSLKSLRDVVGAADKYVSARRKTYRLTEPRDAHFRFGNIVCASPEMNSVCDLIERLANIDSPVLVMGEHGVGKQLAARTIHARSRRKGAPFVRIDCTSLSLESSLSPLLAKAQDGTLFLREIAALPPPLQKDLSATMASGADRMLADGGGKKKNVRVIASTTEPLTPYVSDNAFDSRLLDLLERNTLLIPPLRERADDIRVHLGRALRQGHPEQATLNLIAPEAIQLLLSYSWPGNVSELEETVKDASIMAGGEKIMAEHLPSELVEVARKNDTRKDEQIEIQKLRGQAVRNYLQDKGAEFKKLIAEINAFTND